MGQAIVNPDDLRRFATQLRQFNNDLMAQMTALHGQLAGLSSSWRDREHDKFVEEFETTLKVVARFVDATNQHVPFLLRKAERVEEYLNQR
ncbi:WXG100 family type VII secretion target [Singulisphaera sp. PoT]|uniref:WXG100 family type VII secretion target n=1 Tax=Singulisphaera sp. PoT TaxID=3411797 RepID=UPI003BF5C785